MHSLPTDDPLAVEAVTTIHTGDVATLRQLLTAHPELATVGLGGDVDQLGNGGMTRSLLHVATDWPGHFPHVAATIEALVNAGADVDARFTGPHNETPLHWAASSDDVAALDALLDAGADIEARGAVIGGRTAISDATAFGQWVTARRLLERGASTTLGEAATLGVIDRVRGYLDADAPPTPQEITEAFWSASHGGQRQVAELLLGRGADINWIGWDELTPLDAARRSEATGLAAWIEEHGGCTAAEQGAPPVPPSSGGER